MGQHKIYKHMKGQPNGYLLKRVSLFLEMTGLNMSQFVQVAAKQYLDTHEPHFLQVDKNYRDALAKLINTAEINLDEVGE
jgi:hypothetical protein